MVRGMITVNNIYLMRFVDINFPPNVLLAFFARPGGDDFIAIAKVPD